MVESLLMAAWAVKWYMLLFAGAAALASKLFGTSTADA
jgi:hypothetical protein